MTFILNDIINNIAEMTEMHLSLVPGVPETNVRLNFGCYRYWLVQIVLSSQKVNNYDLKLYVCYPYPVLFNFS